MLSQIHFAVAAAAVIGLCLPARPAGNPPPNQSGFPQELAGGRPYASITTQATIANVDTSHDDKEIIVATQDRNGNTLTCTGHVYVYNPNGTLRW